MMAYSICRARLAGPGARPARPRTPRSRPPRTRPARVWRPARRPSPGRPRCRGQEAPRSPRPTDGGLPRSRGRHVYPRPAEIDRRAGQIHRVQPAADPVPGLQHDALDPSVRQRVRDRQAGNPRADHHHALDRSCHPAGTSVRPSSKLSAVNATTPHRRKAIEHDHRGRPPRITTCRYDMWPWRRRASTYGVARAVSRPGGLRPAERRFSGGAVSAAPEPDSVILGDAERPCTTQCSRKLLRQVRHFQATFWGIRLHVWGHARLTMRSRCWQQSVH